MKTKPLLFLILVFPMLLQSCTDDCQRTTTYRRYTPVTRSMAEIRAAVASGTPHSLKHPGKMYIKGNYLFINEIKEGIHIIDNSNPSSPQFVSFINIPGNGDIAIKDDILYADSFSDLVALDISDINNPKEVGRVQNVFQSGQFDGAWWSINTANGQVFDQSIQDYNIELVTETYSTNCEDAYPVWGSKTASFLESVSLGSAASSASPNSAGGSGGKAGSMARFALSGNFLYTVSQSNLHLFNIAKPASPADISSIPLGWNIETIFPYRNKLFIGSSTGMFIYDNSDPAAPKQLSVFQHGTACDPVVVHDDIAYVTLRTGTACNGSVNQLDLVDVSDPATPSVVKSYQMENPHGLSIDFPTLYLCEGESGLKVFDAGDKYQIDSHLLAHFKDMDAFDVISMDKRILVIGKDGFFQYDASDVKNLVLLSKIAVAK